MRARTQTMAAGRGIRGESTGQALVEFALVMPLFAVLVFGLLDVGRAVWTLDSVNGAAREAARFAVVHGGSPVTACPVGPPASTANVPAASASCPYPSPSKRAIKDAADAAAIAVGGPLTVTVCYGDGCSGDTDAAGATNARGNLVTVRVSSTVSLLLPALLGRSGVTLDSQSTMVVNN